MKVTKSSRHSKITGDFAEGLILYWLSKYGFECAIVDHTGIDIIACEPESGERLGISVKSRSRNTGKEGQYVSIPNGNFDKIDAACSAFGCVPYFAIVVDQGSELLVFITSAEHLLKLHPKGKKVSGWKMSKSWIQRYENDEKIYSFSMGHTIKRWWRDVRNSPPGKS